MYNFPKKLCRFSGMQFGLDPGRFVCSLLRFPRYALDLLRFRLRYKGLIDISPCLHDRYEEAGNSESEYLWQDLLVARKIFTANPQKHVDIGSRLDGFICHIASFREIEVFDVRPVNTKIPGVTFRQVDFMKPLDGMSGYCDSLSCLHALEHFGLGRYGDQLDPTGCEKGMQNIAKILRSGGVLYLSVPVGIEKVKFNAHWIFDPRKLVRLAKSVGMQLSEFSAMRDRRILAGSYDHPQEAIAEASRYPYSLGIFTFVKS